MTREPEASGDTRHGERDKVIQISIGGCGKFECTETDVIKSFIGSEHNNKISSGMRNDPGTSFNNQLNYRKDMVD